MLWHPWAFSWARVAIPEHREAHRPGREVIYSHESRNARSQLAAAWRGLESCSCRAFAACVSVCVCAERTLGQFVYEGYAALELFNMIHC